MTVRSRILKATTPNSPPIQSLDSDFFVILAALICALICVLGLLAVARCSWLRRPSLSAAANKGLKKKVLDSLPKFTYGDKNELAAKLSDCAICLSEFAAGEEIRVLPQCGHGFHVGCIDAWLSSHSSCPSCRLVLVPGKCGNCGVFGMPAAKNSSAIRPLARESYVISFLP